MKCQICDIIRLKPGSQYIVSVSSQPEAINFSMGIDATKRWNRIGFYSSVSPIEKLMASGCDETETIYCEPAFRHQGDVSIY